MMLRNFALAIAICSMVSVPVWAGCPKDKSNHVENSRRTVDEFGDGTQYSYDVCGLTPNGPFRETGVVVGTRDPGITRTKLIYQIASTYEISVPSIQIVRFKK
jgi:hypothetical protein